MHNFIFGWSQKVAWLKFLGKRETCPDTGRWWRTHRLCLCTSPETRKQSIHTFSDSRRRHIKPQTVMQVRQSRPHPEAKGSQNPNRRLHLQPSQSIHEFDKESHRRFRLGCKHGQQLLYPTRSGGFLEGNTLSEHRRGGSFHWSIKNSQNSATLLSNNSSPVA